MRIILLAYMIAFLLVMPLSAKNLYVNNSIGNDATTYANNSQSTPWASVGRAVWGSTDPNATNSGEAAAAGDTVFVSAGTYSTDVTCSRGETEGLYRTVNSGTSGNLIVFYAQGTVDLRQTNAAMAVLGMHDSYVEWNGFTINSANNSLRPNYEMTLVDFGGTGNRLLNCDLTMGYFPFAGNNTPCIYVHTSTDGYIANNTLDGSSGDGGENNSAMTFYNNNNLIVEYNTIAVEQGASGIYIKAPQSCCKQTELTIRRNLIYGKGSISGQVAMRILTAEPDTLNDANTSNIYENLIYDCESGISLTPITDEWRDIDELQVYNNTIYNVTYGVHIGGGFLFDNVDFYNNLIHTASSAYWSYSNDGANATFRAEFIPNYNGYYNITSANFFLSDANYTYSEWQAIWGDANSPDSTSVTGTAIFTDAANDNYRIVAGHDALTAGNTGGELGCYANVDTVGVLGSLGGETPAAPSSVTLKMTFQED